MRSSHFRQPAGGISAWTDPDASVNRPIGTDKSLSACLAQSLLVRLYRPNYTDCVKDSSQTDRIRHIAAELFAAKGYNGVGVAEIGDATGLGRGALYHHIGSKEDLLYDIASRYIADLVESGRQIAAKYPDPIARIRQLSSHLMHAVGQHQAEMTVCFREVDTLSGEHHTNVSRLHAEYEQIWVDAVAAGVATGVFRKIKTEKIAIKGLLGMYFYSFLWLDPNGRHSPGAIGDVFSDLFVRAFAAEKGLATGAKA